MGYIAPSLWMMNEYGRGLSKKLKRTRQLDRWVHFKSFQVFEDARLHPGASISVENSDDELRMKIGDVVVLEIFDEPDTPFIAAQWRLATRDLNITEKFTAKKLVSKLLALRKTDHSALKERSIALDAEITELDKRIAAAENDMNEMVYGLYGLTDEEIAVVESG